MTPRPQPTSPAGAAPIVGREVALGTLAGALAATSRSEPTAVLVRGDPGIGKSRLVQEFVAADDGRAVPLWGSCINIADPPAYGPWMSVLRGALHELGETGIEQLPVQSRAYLARLLGESSEQAEPLADPRNALFEAVAVTLERAAATRETVLIIEDAHWIDRSSWDLLTYLMNELDRHRVMTVVTHRPLAPGHWLRHPLLELSRLRTVIDLELAPLSREAVAELATVLSGRRPGDDHLEAIVRKSGGNPFFVELLSGEPSSGDGRIREHLVAAIEHLPNESRQVLHTAAVAAPHVGHELLAAVTGLPESGLDDAARHAVEACMLVVEGDGYRFRHALLADAVYEEIVLPGERVRLHRALAAAIDADPALARPERCFAPGEAGRHWEAGGDADRAIVAYWRAAREARDFKFHRERARMLSKVLALWEHVSDARDLLDVSSAELMMQVVEAADLSGDLELGMDRADAAIRSALAEGLPQVAALVLERRARMRRRLGIQGATEDLLEALRLIEAHPESSLRARLLGYLAQRFWLSGHPRAEVEEAANEALDVAERVGDSWAAAHARLTLTWPRALDGEFDVARRLHRQVRADAASLPDGHLLIYRSFVDESSLLVAAGELPQAADAARHGMRIATDIGLTRTFAAQAAAHLADPLIALGSWDEAWEVIDAALAAGPPRGYRATLLRLRARISMWRGDLDAESADMDEIRRTIGPRFETPDEQFAFAQLVAESLLLRGEWEQGWRAVHDALNTYTAASSPSLAWALLALGARALREITSDTATPRSHAARREVERLSTTAERLPFLSTRCIAWRACFLANTAVASVRQTARRDEVAAWRRAQEPARIAAALITAAEDALHRETAGEHLREAAGIAARLSADTLSKLANSTAERLGVGIEATPALTPGGAGDATARSWNLTPRETEVLQELAMGKTNREIASALFITPKTASVHVSRILMKMGASTRSEATAKAFRHRAVDLDGEPQD